MPALPHGKDLAASPLGWARILDADPADDTLLAFSDWLEDMNLPAMAGVVRTLPGLVETIEARIETLASLDKLPAVMLLYHFPGEPALLSFPTEDALFRNPPIQHEAIRLLVLAVEKGVSIEPYGALIWFQHAIGFRQVCLTSRLCAQGEAVTVRFRRATGG